MGYRKRSQDTCSACQLLRILTLWERGNYLFSNQVPPISAFFSYTTCSTFSICRSIWRIKFKPLTPAPMVITRICRGVPSGNSETWYEAPSCPLSLETPLDVWSPLTTWLAVILSRLPKDRGVKAAASGKMVLVHGRRCCYNFTITL